MRIVEPLLEPLDGCVGKLAHAKKTQRRSRRRRRHSRQKADNCQTLFCASPQLEQEHIRKYLNVCLRFSGYA